jgi:excisionase family DNA binding protein
MEKLYTPEQAAEILQVTPKTVRTWLQTKQLKGFMAGRFWRIKESDLQAFLREPNTVDEDLDDIAAAEEALKDPRRYDYHQTRRELGL